MKTLNGVHCAVCGAASVDKPRLLVEQDRHYDCPREHSVGLCATHGEALRVGEITPQQILYQWVQENHDDLYDGTRLHLLPRLTCLGCNEPFATSDDAYTCAKCGAVNVIGSALGHPAAIRIAR
jgi:Zn finger protein HypA/HybF involved in hydrogenase expression